MQQRVDKTALKVNQGFITSLVVLAWVLDGSAGPVIIGLVAAVMCVGAAFPEWNLFRISYLKVFKPTGILKPNVAAEDPTPHRFAFGLGGVFMAASTAAFAFSVPTVGWVLAWIVFTLAFINLTVNFCMGCFIYYHLGRAGLLPSH